MRWPFRRDPSGRHALGAAVTAIPSRPGSDVPAPVVPAFVPSPELPTVRADVTVAPMPALSVQPLRTGPMPQPPPLAEPVVEQLRAVDVTSTQGAAPLPHADPVELVVPLELLDALPPREVSLEALDRAPAESMPVQQPAVAVPVVLAVPAQAAAVDLPRPPVVVPAQPEPVDAEPLPMLRPVTGPRVELGFADGTYRMLDPASDTARALSDLVEELKGRPRPEGSVGA